jgi:hypothetical protein
MEQFLAHNSHETACRGSQKFANHLINYLHNKLLANQDDPEILLIITFYSLYLNGWNTAYSQWRAAINFEMSTTQEMNILDKNLIEEKAPEWQGKIYSVYYEGTSNATALFPHGRQALIAGKPEEKIAGMNTLINGIGNDADLQVVKADLQTFVNLYTIKSQQHQAAMKNWKDLSKDQERLRLLTTAAMHGCEGKLTGVYWQTPEKVDLFFDIAAMRRRNSHSAKDAPLLIKLLPSEIKLIDIDYTFNDIWEVTNNGIKEACVFFGNTSNIIEIPKKKTVIDPNMSVKINLSSLASDMRFAYAANLSKEDMGELSFTLQKSSNKPTIK